MNLRTSKISALALSVSFVLCAPTTSALGATYFRVDDLPRQLSTRQGPVTVPGSAHKQYKAPGNFDIYCNITESVSGWQVNSMGNGKRVLRAVTYGVPTMTAIAERDRQVDDAYGKCNNAYNWALVTQTFGPHYICPERSSFEDPNDPSNNPTTACDSQNPYSPTGPCGMEMNQLQSCQTSSSCPAGMTCLPPMSFLDSILRSAYALPPPESGGDCTYYSERYYSCVNRASPGYYACVDRVSSNVKTGTADCYCNARDLNGAYTDYMAFNGGTWSCEKCPGEGELVQDRETGTKCVSRCKAQGPDYAWDPASRSCQKCNAPNVVRGGKCQAPCGPNEAENPATGACEQVCPSGMTAKWSDPVNKTGTLSCECSLGTQFITPSGYSSYGRSSVKRTTLSGRSIWEYNSAPPPAGTASMLAGSCACSRGMNSPDVSPNDTSDVIARLQPDSPYGPVALNVNATEYACGCPNYNEEARVDPSDGKWKCMPYLRPDSSGQGLVLAPIDERVSLPMNGVQSTRSDLPNIATASLRAPGSNGMDLSVPYSRRVWRCAKGWVSVNGQCVPVTQDPSMHACGDSGIVSSTTLNSRIPPRTQFSRLINQRLACCLADGNSMTSTLYPKFHCAASAPQANQSFDQYFNAPGGDLASAGVSYPNRLYLLDSNNTPVVGFYREDGARCTFMDGLPKSRQLQVLSDVVARVRTNPANRSSPFTGVSGLPTNIDSRCRFAVRAALEVNCPMNDVTDPVSGTNTVTIAGADRCAVASDVRVHYDVQDLSDPSSTRRTIMKPLSTIGTGAMGTLAAPLDVKALLKGK